MSQWFVVHNDKLHGPFSIEEIRSNVESGFFSFSNQVWTPSTQKWVTIKDLIVFDTSTLVRPTWDNQQVEAKNDIEENFTFIHAQPKKSNLNVDELPPDETDGIDLAK